MALDLGELYATVHLRGGDGFRREVDRNRRELRDLDRQAGDSSGRMGGMFDGLVGALGRVGTGLLPVAKGLALFGSAVPLVAGVVAALVQIAPAAAVGATAIVGVGVAVAALKIGMSGVGDAVKAAFDPSNPKAYAKALEKLSPNARAFVGVLHDMQPQFAGIKRAIQDTLFAGLDRQLRTTATATLPALYGGLHTAAQALNAMGAGVLSTARSLGKNGTLGAAISGATDGLKSLTKIPAQIVKAIVQIAAAAAPTFKRLTAAVGGVATTISQKLSGAFKSGAMSQAIDIAVGLLKQLGTVVKNVFTVVKNVFAATQASGGGFIGTLTKISGALAEVSANPAFQAGLRALFSVMSQLATTAAPLLAQALLGIAPVVAALGPPLQVLIQALGTALQPVIAALGPVLVAAAQAVGQLVIALAPLLPVVGQVIAALLPILVPVLQLLTTVLTALTPVIAVVAQALTTYFVPVITAVVGAVTTAVNWLKNLYGQAFPAVGSAVTALGPSLAGLKGALGDLWTALQPLIGAIGALIRTGFQALQPYLPSLGDALKILAKIFIGTLKLAIEGATLSIQLTVTAINKLTNFLNGDATTSLKGFGQTVTTVSAGIVTSISSWTSKTTPVVAEWCTKIAAGVRSMGQKVGQIIGDMYDDVAQVMVKVGLKIPGALRAAVGAARAAAAAIGHAVVAALEFEAPELVWVVRTWVKGMVGILQAVGPRMLAIGKSIVSSLTRGIKSAIPSLSGLLRSITDLIPSWKGPPSRDAVLLYPAGQAVMGGFIGGISSRVPELNSLLNAITQNVRNTINQARAAAAAATGTGPLASATAEAALNAATKAAAKISLPAPIPGGGGGGGRGGGGGGGGGSKAKPKLTNNAVTFTFSNLGKAAVAAFIKGLSSFDPSKIDATAKQLSDAVRKAFAGFAGKTKIDDGLLALISSTNKKLQGMATARQKIADKLQEALAFAASVKAGGQSFASALGLSFTDDTGAQVAPQADTIISGLKGKLATLQNFGSDIASLVRAKLSPTVLRQLLDAGPEQAAAMADAIVAGGANAVDAINGVQGQIDQASKALGETGADYLYDAGDKAGQGFLTGLKGQLDVLEQSMEDLATRLLNAVTAGIAKAQKIAAKAAMGETPSLTELGVGSTTKAAPKATPKLAAASAPKAALHIENYHEAPRGSARGTAEELLLLTNARG